MTQLVLQELKQCEGSKIKHSLIIGEMGPGVAGGNLTQQKSIMHDLNIELRIVPPSASTSPSTNSSKTGGDLCIKWYVCLCVFVCNYVRINVFVHVYVTGKKPYQGGQPVHQTTCIFLMHLQSFLLTGQGSIPTYSDSFS